MFVLLSYLLVLNFITLIAVLINFKYPTEENLQKSFIKFCPCRKMAQNGILYKIAIYSAMGGFLLSSTFLSLIEFNLYALFSLFLSLLCAYLTWFIKK
ncbi:hypothetical protein [Campylobacter sp. US33a]|uniref:DUF3784 domain-containing protein n=1 Tax=Campylobacter sp. CCS1377 TaxID=3158229 RepID=A0AAU7EA33_9BACT|nr:hypothetical protein ELQ16_06070 [Campylobacter sp. US33a]